MKSFSASSKDGRYVVVMPFADRLGPLPEMPGLVLVMLLKRAEEGHGSLFRVSETSLHPPDPTPPDPQKKESFNILAMYQPRVEFNHGQKWQEAKLSLHFPGEKSSVICGEGEQACEFRVGPGRGRLVFVTINWKGLNRFHLVTHNINL